MKLPYFFLAGLLLFAFLETQGQNPGAKVQAQIDSLNQELTRTKNDTSRIRLRFWLGQKARISRTSYWDSLASDAHRQGYPVYEARTLNTLGYYCRLQNKDEQALKSLNRSYDIARETGNKPGTFAPLFNLANYYFIKNDIKKSLTYSFMALKVAEETKDRKKAAMIYAQIGLSYFSAREFKKALAMHMKSLRLSEELKNEEEIASNLMTIGSDYAWMHDTTNTVTYYLACKKYTDTFGESAVAVDVNNSIASAYNLSRSFDSAYKYCNKAYKIALSLGSKPAMASSLSIMTFIMYGMGDLKNAERIAREGLAISKEIGFTLQVPSLTEALKNIYIKRKDYKSALEAYEMNVAANDSLSAEKVRKDIAEKEFNYNLEKKEIENKLLAQKNKVQEIELKQNNYLILMMGTAILVIFLIGYLFVRQNKLKAGRQKARLEQKLLLSQMNPHFIFNSLQAIQNFILKHDEKEAVKYLSSFASVTRNVLENSRMELIPLKKEIVLLDNYLQLQRLRFKNRFSYEIRTNNITDPEIIAVPPMLAQPFIENAIEHGFYGLEGEGLIQVSYSIKDNELFMEITDNGIGMQGQMQNKGHRSLALDITRERVALINKKAKEKVKFNISAAFPLNHERKGVRVSFCFPLDIKN